MHKLGNTIRAAVKEKQTVAPDGTAVLDLISGVRFIESKNVMTKNGVTTELFKNYQVDIKHMIHVVFRPAGIAAWNLHMGQTDHIFATMGTLKVVLYDDRVESPTHGKLNIFYLSPQRPALLVIPPRIWHGVQNLEAKESGFINFFDNPYSHTDPDNWRLPFDSELIPFSFK